MSQEMTSFVVRFVREVSDEQGARWRGLIQHVQSGAEKHFSSFADAVQFMQGQVVESTLRGLDAADPGTGPNPLADITKEMSRMWGEVAPQMTELWTRSVAQMMEQSTAFRSQVDQAVAATLRAWGLPPEMDQGRVAVRMERLARQIDQLTTRVQELEEQLAARGETPETGE
jgi:hypothetical protein